MTTEREVSLTRSVADAPATEAADFDALRERAVTQLRLQAESLAGRWDLQARVVMPDDGGGDIGVHAGRRAGALALIRSLATALAADGAAADDAVGLGLEFGAAAFASGAMLHHMLRTLDLLVAMCLFALEETLGAADDDRTSAADGIRLCRRLQQASALSARAASRGYLQAANDATREQFRRLRHDMRNPLGTIQSALSLMDDESIPEEARRNPRYRAMIQRNARALDELIVARLADAKASSPIGAQQQIPPRAVAWAVRRDLRAEADARGVTVTIASTIVHHRFDAAGVELVLHDILLSLLQRARDQDVVMIDFGERPEGRVSIEVACTPTRTPLLAEETLCTLRIIASRLDLSLEAIDERLVLSFSAARDERDDARPDAASSPSALVDRRQMSNDVGSARQHKDREPRPL